MKTNTTKSYPLSMMSLPEFGLERFNIYLLERSFYCVKKFLQVFLAGLIRKHPMTEANLILAFCNIVYLRFFSIQAC